MCRRAFSLIELIVFLIIIGALVGLAVPRYIQSTKKARLVAFESNVKDIVQTLQVYNANSTLDPSMSLYPSSLEDLKFKNMFKKEPTNPYTGKSMLSSAPVDSGIQYQSDGTSYSICIAQQDIDDINNNGRIDDLLPVTSYPACTSTPSSWWRDYYISTYL